MVPRDSKSGLPLVLSVNDSTDADLKSENSLVFLDFFSKMATLFMKVPLRLP